MPNNNNHSALVERVRLELARTAELRADPRNRINGYAREIRGKGRTRTLEAYSNLRRLILRMHHLVSTHGYSIRRAAYVVTDLDDRAAERIERYASTIASRAIFAESTLDKNRNLVLPSEDRIEQIFADARLRAATEIKADDRKRGATKSKHSCHHPHRPVGDQHMYIDAENLRRYYRKWRRGELAF